MVKRVTLGHVTIVILVLGSIVNTINPLSVPFSICSRVWAPENVDINFSAFSWHLPQLPFDLVCLRFGNAKLQFCSQGLLHHMYPWKFNHDSIKD